MPDLIDILESFNRKERFFLVAQALGKPKFTLSREFRLELGEKVGLTAQGIEIPTDAFAAMDYHLNWVHASLVLAFADPKERVDLINTPTVESVEKKAAEQNQEDVDLLVAFKDDNGHHHLIFVEAKGYDANGFAGVDKGQLCSKVKRLRKIINPNGGSGYKNTKTYFCLMSGYKPQNLKSDDWPKWNEKPLHWMPLSLPEKRHVLNYSDFSIVKQEKGEAKSKFKSETVVSGKKEPGEADEGQA